MSLKEDLWKQIVTLPAMHWAAPDNVKMLFLNTL